MNIPEPILYDDDTEVRIKLSSEERELLSKKAYSNGKSSKEYIKSLMLEAIYKTSTPKEQLESTEYSYFKLVSEYEKAA